MIVCHRCLKTAALSLGVHEIGFGAQDDEGAWSAEAMRTLTVTSANVSPTAYIESISPKPASYREGVPFAGRGEDADGRVVAYLWRSSRHGCLSRQSSFATDRLSAGPHTIQLKLQITMARGPSGLRGAGVRQCPQTLVQVRRLPV